MIPKSFISNLVDSCDIEDIVGGYVSLKRAGRNLKGLCPFHSEHTPSFVIYKETQSFYCFGCGAGGEVISFIMRAENLEYPEAVRFLAARMGMTVPEEGQTDETTRLKGRILEMNKIAARFFHKCLLSDAGKEGMRYFKEERGLEDSIITEYGLGYAPQSWNMLLNYLKKKGYSEYEIVSAALAVKGKNNSVYDQFRNRVMFPIIDIRGNVIGFGGRVLDDSKPKYLNSADTLAFKKSRNLFSLNFAKTQSSDKLILAEGYMDVIAMYAAGFKNVVATLGTSLTEEQARLMSKYAKEIVISYDSDEAGQKAAYRAINILSQAGLSVKVLHMEGAKDPDEYIKKFGTKRFEKLIEGSVGAIDHELAVIEEKYDMENPQGVIDYTKDAIAVLAEIDDRITREVYGARVAKKAGIDKETIYSRVKALTKKKAAAKNKREWMDIQSNKEALRDRVNPEKARNLREAVAEESIIAALFKNSDYYEYIAAKITCEGFVTAFNKKVFEKAMSLYSEKGEIKLVDFSEEFSAAEHSAIAGIIARNIDKSFSQEDIEVCIGILLEHKDKLAPESAKDKTADELEELRRKIAEKHS